MRKIIFFLSALFIIDISAQSQNVGIGTTTPIARLEVKGAGNNSSTNNLVLKNSNDDTLFRVRNDGRMGIGFNGGTYGRTLNIGGTGINLYKTDTKFGGAILPTDTSMILWSEVDRYLIFQPSWGKVGIGTYSPKAKLHVRNGASGATPASSAVSVFESDLDASINIITPSTEESAIYFGNPANALHGGIVYNSTVANGLAFRTNGNSTKAVINSLGNMGIGDITPNARLHVSSGTGGGVYFSDADLILEDNSQSYIQFSTPNTSASGLLAGNSVTDIRSAILFLADSSITFRSGGNLTRVSIEQNGNVGVGTVSPSSLLEVNGSAGKPGGGSWSNSSDIRLKKDIRPYTSGLESLLKINPVYYHYNKMSGYDTQPEYVGVIAQQLMEIAPDMVSVSNKKTADGVHDYLEVNNSAMTYMLINAVKEQQLQIEALKKEIEALKSSVASRE